MIKIKVGLLKRYTSEIALFIAALSVVIIDQVSKHFIRTELTLGQKIPEEGFFQITRCNNTGGVFGLFADQAFLITIVAVVGIVAILVYSRYPAFNGLLVRISLGLLMGGAIGNLIDRIRFGWVTDFIDIGGWPVFNLGDSAIVIGVILILYHFIFRTRKIEAQTPEDAEDEHKA
jgi:signal peptidase II